MELETAWQAAVKFESTVQDSTQLLLWDSHATTVQWHIEKVKLKAEG